MDLCNGDLFQCRDCRSNVDYRALLQKELVFLGDCLRVNPKAYGVWLHREWVMLHIPDPDWKQELGLCDLFLKHDERNCK